MIDKKLFFYGLTLKDREPLLGASCQLQRNTLYFATQEKLEKWRKMNPDISKDAEWGMCEITLKCARELIRLAKKKVKHRCGECGK